MGKNALKSHASGSKHKMKETLLGKKTSIKTFLNSATPSVVTNTSQHRPTENEEVTEAVTPDTQHSISFYKKKTAPISSFVVNDDVLKAEILWAIKTVVNHYSASSCANTDKLFQRMFYDSEIAKRFSCGKTKCAYMIKFGLAPYFKSQIQSQITNPESLLVIMFDESYNTILQKEQMDIYVRYWDNEKNKVLTRYYNSKFLGHTRAIDLFENFLNGIGLLNQSNIIQISMDGPAVNHKFHKNLCDRWQMEDPQRPQLINIGSCSLHIVHGAFKTGAIASGWNVDGILRALHYVLRDAPARADDFQQITGNAALPLAFCSTRWLEDVAVAEKAIDMWPDVEKYVNEISRKPKSKIPKIQSFQTLQQCCNDLLTVAKMQFFATQAKMLKPFLEKYQTKKPMIVFLSDDLQYLLLQILQRFVKSNVLSETTNVYSLDFDNDDIIVSPLKTEIGFAVRSSIKKVEKKVSHLQLLKFYSECQLFLKSMASKLLEKCPLKYPIVRNISSLDPRVVVNDSNTAHKKFDNVLSKLLELKRLTASECDQAKFQFMLMTSEAKKIFKYDFESFSVETDRIDEFYFQLLGSNSEYGVLWKVLKLLLLLAPGQAEIERGFSVNKDILTANLGDDTLCAYKTVYDALEKLDVGSHDITISREMLSSCRSSRNRYMQFLNERKTVQSQKANVKEEENKELKNELHKLQKEALILETESNRLFKRADELCENGRKSKDWATIEESLALRDRAKLKRKLCAEAGDKVLKTKKRIKELQ